METKEMKMDVRRFDSPDERRLFARGRTDVVTIGGAALALARGKRELAATVARLMPAKVFTGVRQLIQKAVGDDWPELSQRILPEEGLP